MERRGRLGGVVDVVDVDGLVVDDDVDGLVADDVADVSVPWRAGERAGGGPAHLLDGVGGVVVGGEVGGLELGLDSCEEEVLQSSAADSYLRLGLVEQRELDPAPWSESDLDSLMTSSMLARPTWMMASSTTETRRPP